jgi:hypothetical protein
MIRKRTLRDRAAIGMKERVCKLESGAVLLRAEKVAQLFLLRLKVLFGVRAGFDFAWHALDDFYSGPLQCLDLLRIIREQPHLAYTERLEYLAGEGKVALVGLEAQPLVGLDGVQTGILQLIRLQLSHKTDAATLLLFVNKDPRPIVADHRQRHLELLPAVAAQRMKNVTGEALRVNPYQRRSRVHVAHHKGNSFLHRTLSILAGFGAKAVDAELAPSRGKIRGRYLLYRIHSLIIAAVR